MFSNFGRNILLDVPEDMLFTKCRQSADIFCNVQLIFKSNMLYIIFVITLTL